MDNLELLVAYASGDITAKEQLLIQNLGLIRKVANKYALICEGKIAYDDFYQEGCIGLLKAIEGFDITLGCQFSGYALQWISQKIIRYAKDNSRSIRIPEHCFQSISSIKKCKEKLTIKLNRKPQLNEIAAALNISIEKVAFILDLQKDITSLDCPIDEAHEDTSLMDILQDHSEGIEDSILKKEFKDGVHSWIDETLDVQRKKVLISYYGLDGTEGQTLESIGEMYNLSRERIRKIKCEAERKLRAKAYILKRKTDYQIDLRTNFYKGGRDEWNDPVSSNVIKRENERERLRVLREKETERLQRLHDNDHPFYKWYRCIKEERYRSYDSLKAKEEIQKIDTMLKHIDSVIVKLLSSEKNTIGYILFRRMGGSTEEETKLSVDCIENYQELELEGLEIILNHLNDCGINTNEELMKF